MVIEMNSEKSRILDLLEQGRITVDEAVMLLEALGEKNAKEMTKRYRRGDKKNDFDEKASKIVDEIGKKINYFIENLGQYFSEGIERAGDFAGSFAGKRRFERNIRGTVRDGAKVEIRTYGSVDIRGIDSPAGEFRLELFIRADDEDEADALLRDAFQIRTSEDEIFLDLRERRETWVDAVLYLPRNFRYDLQIHSVNGRIRLNDLDLAAANLETVNGRVLVERCSGETVNVKTLNGSIDAIGSFKVLDAATQNGSIEYSLLGDSTSASLNSTNGPLRVRLPVSERFDYNIEARTVWGRIFLDLPVRNLEVNRERENYLHATTMAVASYPKDQVVRLQAGTSNSSITILPLENQ